MAKREYMGALLEDITIDALRRDEMVSDNFGAYAMSRYGADDDDDEDDDLSETDFSDLEEMADEPVPSQATFYGGDYEWYGEEDDFDAIDRAISYGLAPGGILTADVLAQVYDVRGNLVYPGWASADLTNQFEKALSLSKVMLADDTWRESISALGEGTFQDTGEPREIGCYICNYLDKYQAAVRPTNWQGLENEEKIALVKAAVAASALPGIELNVDDPVKDLISIFGEKGWWAALKQTPGVLLKVMGGGVKDAVAAIATLLDNVIPPVQEAARDASRYVTGKQLVFESPDQFVNKLAIFYAVAGRWTEGRLYQWMVDEIDRTVGDFGPATTVEDSDIPAEDRVPAYAPSEEVSPMVLPPIPASFEIPVPRRGPRPQDILAVGYATICIGALTGLLK